MYREQSIRGRGVVGQLPEQLGAGRAGGITGTDQKRSSKTAPHVVGTELTALDLVREGAMTARVDGRITSTSDNLRLPI